MFPPLVLNIPNLLTLLRVLLVPVFVVCIATERHLAALGVFAFAGFTDALDGFIAKRFGQETEFGVTIDPIADKILLVSAYIVLAIKGWVPLFLCVLVLSRDAVILGICICLVRSKRELKVSPSLPGKITTVLQILTVVYALYLAGVPDTLLTILVYATAFMVVFSGFHYLAREIKFQRGAP